MAFAWTLKILLVFFPVPSFQRKVKPVSSSSECNQCLYSISPVPSIPWPAIRVAIGRVSLPAVYFFGILSKLLCFRCLTGEINTPTSLVCTVLSHLHNIFTMRLVLHDAHTTATSSMVYLLLPPQIVL